MNTTYSHRGLTDPDFITKLKNSKFLLEVENNKNLVVGIRDVDSNAKFPHENN